MPNPKTPAKHNKFTSKISCAIIALVLFCALIIAPVSEAAGSIQLTENGGYRGSIEWYNGNTAGIPRYQYLYVYAKEGESILLATSGFENTANADIVYYKPTDINTPINIDVIMNGDGYIASPAMEAAGPYYEYKESGVTVGACGNPDGYTPIEIQVGAGETGVWKIEFHSRTDTAQNGNGTQKLTSAQWNSTQNGLVSAWDITVVQNPHTSSPNFKTGRMFTNYLCLNLCFNSNSTDYSTKILNSIVYVLTNDGYIYKTDLNGIDPWGFIFFANNRGLVVKNGNSTASLYASAVDAKDDNTLRYLQYIYPNAEETTTDVTFHMPNEADTELDQTFKIFFEMPADDLPATIRATPYAPGQVSDFRFSGDKINHGYVGCGGYFYFNATRASSFQIKMDFSGIGGGVRMLSNACVDGENRIYWDGRDGNGNIVPAAVYDSSTSGIKVSISLKAGEYHFPMLDVENAYSGVKIRLMNTPLDSNNNELELTESDRCSVHFDNRLIYDTTALNSYTDEELSGQYAVNALVDSVDTSVYGASAYRAKRKYKTKTSTTSQGDCAAIDIWTFYNGSESLSSATLESFELEDVPESNDTGVADGFVFFDANKNGTFSQSEKDYELQHVVVELWSTGSTPVKLAETTTDLYGQYVFRNYTDSLGNTHDIPYGEYTIKIKKPIDNVLCTTLGGTQINSANEINQSITIDKALKSAEDVGFFYATLSKPIVVYKTWTIDKSSDPNQPDSIVIQLTGWAGTVGEGEAAYESEAVVSLANGWKTTFRNLPQYASDGTTPLTYRVKELMRDALGNPIDGYTSTVQPPEEVAEAVEYEVKNTADCSITLKKVDAALTDKPVVGSTFRLYDNSDPLNPVLLDTQLTNENGYAVFNGLKPGSYYYVESLSPLAYELDSTQRDVLLTATNTGYAPEFLVTNNPKTKDITLKKTLSSVSASDETFVYEITGPDGTFYATVTIPAGDTIATVTLADMLIGTYAVRELPTNWRYSVKASETVASDGTDTFEYLGEMLTMTVGETGVYSFNFTNERTSGRWTSATAKVTNVMSPLT